MNVTERVQDKDEEFRGETLHQLLEDNKIYDHVFAHVIAYITEFKTPDILSLLKELYPLRRPNQVTTTVKMFHIELYYTYNICKGIPQLLRHPKANWIHAS
jgi:hypothetical protein